MIAVVRQIGLLAGKDLRIEARTRQTLGLVLVLGAVFCTVAGYFGVQPMMAAARLGQGALSFGQLHAISAAFFAVKLVLVAVLAWRAAALAAIRPPSS